MMKLQQLIQDMCPNGVEWKPFSELGIFYGGLSGKNKDDFKDGNAKYITYLNIGCNPALRLDILETVKIDPNEKQNKVQYGDALFTGSSETPDECAMSSVVIEQPTEDIYLNSFCFGFRFNSLDGICPAFYKHYFRSDAFRKTVRRTANGTTRFNVSKKEFSKLEIPIPPLEIQKKIVECLDKFSALAAELQAELQMRRKQYEYYRTQLLTPHSDCNSATKSDDCNWEWKTLGELCVSIKDGMHNLPASSLEETDYPIISAQNIFDNKIDYIAKRYVEKATYEKENKRTNVEVGDVLLTIVATIGRSAVVTDNRPVLLQRSVCVLKPSEKIYPKFLKYSLDTNRVQSYMLANAHGAAQAGLYLNQVEQIKIALPPLKEQKRIADLLEKFDKLITSMEDGIPAEQAAQQKRYEYYRDLLLTFDRKAV